MTLCQQSRHDEVVPTKRCHVCGGVGQVPANPAVAKEARTLVCVGCNGTGKIPKELGRC